MGRGGGQSEQAAIQVQAGLRNRSQRIRFLEGQDRYIDPRNQLGDSTSQYSIDLGHGDKMLEQLGRKPDPLLGAEINELLSSPDRRADAEGLLARHTTTDSSYVSLETDAQGAHHVVLWPDERSPANTEPEYLENLSAAEIAEVAEEVQKLHITAANAMELILEDAEAAIAQRRFLVGS